MNRHAGMNRIYRLIWRKVRGAWVAVSGTARGQGKGGSGRRSLLFEGLVPLALLSLPCIQVQAAPTGGLVVSGSGSIAQSGNTTTIRQNSQNLSLNWRTFNVGTQETVNFNQPGASALAVNRIHDTNGSRILGHLNANGQVWLINPNGVLFGQGAQVNVGGLVASTLDVSDAELADSTRSFSGGGRGSVVNRGTINARYVALLGNTVSNQGTITADVGTAALGAGSAVTLTFAGDDLVQMQVDRSTLDSLAENGGLIRADGGRVLLSAGAKDAVLVSVVNNTGVIEARTVQNKNGVITLLGSMAAGTVDVGGTLDASAPNGGDGGFIETSAAHVHVADDATVTTRAPNGASGTWLIDPVDFTIAASGGDMTGAAVDSALAGGNLTILSSGGGTAGGSGNINVDEAVSWSANTLTLTAAKDIDVNAVMTATGSASLALNPATANGADAAVAGGTVNVGLNSSGSTGRVDFSGTGTLSIGGTAYTVINGLGVAGDTGTTTLQGMMNNLTGHYVLGADIDASATSGWNSGAGFTPVGGYYNSAWHAFSGVFDGLGHTVSNLTINSGLSKGIALFGENTGTIRNVGLVNAGVTGTGESLIGGLVGWNDSGTITNAYATGAVSGGSYIGGLVGESDSGTITNAYATGAVTGSGNYVGGLIGMNQSGTIMNAYAAGAVTGSVNYVGGLVGNNISGTITNAYATGAVSGSSYVGGLVGWAAGTIQNAYATGAVSGSSYVGGLVGFNTFQILYAYATGAVTGSGNDVGGLGGHNNVSGNIQGAFWDTDTTGATSGVGTNSGGLVTATGLTDADMRTSGKFSGFTFTTTPGASGNNWVIVDADGTLNNAGGGAGATYPMLASEYATRIVNAHQLQLMAMAPAADYTLAEDIDAAATAAGSLSDVWGSGTYTGVGFAPIGNGTTQFTGTFDGQNHIISNLTIDNSTDIDAGLFGEVGAGGVVENVGLSGGSVTSTASTNSVYVGDLVGRTFGTITNAYATGTVSGGSDVGGLAGANGGTITNGYATGDVSGSGDSDVGGLAGWNGGTITNTYATGNVSGGSGGTLGSVGGLVGVNGMGNTITNGYATGDVRGSGGAVGGLVGTNGGPITNTYATGAVSGSGTYVGGLVGKNGTGSGTLTNGYATGAVSGSGSTVGGLVGENISFGTITNVYWDKDTTGAASGAGINTAIGTATGLSDNQMKQQASFSGFDFTTPTWIIYENHTTPLLNVFLTPLTITADNQSQVYTGQSSAATFSSASFSASGAPAAFFTKPAPTSLFDPHLIDGNTPYSDATNVSTYSSNMYSDQQGYRISYTNAQLTITPAQLTVTAGNASKTYGQTPTLTVFTSSGLQNGETIGSVTETSAGTSVTASVSGGPYTITPSAATGGSFNPANYTISYVDGTLTVNPAALTISGITASNKVYDGGTAATVDTSAATYTGLVSGDVVTVSATGAFSDKNVGTGKTVTLASSYSGADVGNYAITGQASTTADITPAALSIGGITASNKTYNGTTTATVSTTGATYTGLVSGDAVTVSATGAFSDKNVGTGKTVTLASSYSGADVGNYTITGQASTTADITPATLVYAATPSEILQGQPMPPLSGKVTGFAAEDNLANATGGILAWISPATSTSPTGTYAIDGSGLSANFGDYVFLEAAGNASAFSIVPNTPPQNVLNVRAAIESLSNPPPPSLTGGGLNYVYLGNSGGNTGSAAGSAGSLAGRGNVPENNGNPNPLIFNTPVYFGGGATTRKIINGRGITLKIINGGIRLPDLFITQR